MSQSESDSHTADCCLSWTVRVTADFSNMNTQTSIYTHISAVCPQRRQVGTKVTSLEKKHSVCLKSNRTLIWSQRCFINMSVCLCVCRIDQQWQYRIYCKTLKSKERTLLHQYLERSTLSPHLQPHTGKHPSVRPSLLVVYLHMWTSTRWPPLPLCSDL